MYLKAKIKFSVLVKELQLSNLSADDLLKDSKEIIMLKQIRTKVIVVVELKID